MQGHLAPCGICSVYGDQYGKNSPGREVAVDSPHSGKGGAACGYPPGLSPQPQESLPVDGGVSDEEGHGGPHPQIHGSLHLTQRNAHPHQGTGDRSEKEQEPLRPEAPLALEGRRHPPAS